MFEVQSYPSDFIIQYISVAILAQDIHFGSSNIHSSLQLVLQTMTRVLRVDEHFSSEQLGTALARMWTVNGLALELVDITDACGSICDGDLCICTFTTERPINPGMTKDGHVYSMRYITEWLQENHTSPNTNETLTHKCIMRLSSLKDVIEQFLSRCQSHNGAARAQREIDSLRAVESMTRYDQMQAATDKLNSYIASSEFEIQW